MNGEAAVLICTENLGCGRDRDGTTKHKETQALGAGEWCEGKTSKFSGSETEEGSQFTWKKLQKTLHDVTLELRVSVDPWPGIELGEGPSRQREQHVLRPCH